MAIGLLGLILIQIGLSLLGRLLQGRTKRQKPAPFDVPKAESGAVIPKHFGIQQISGNIFLVRDKTIIAGAEDRKYYQARIAMALGHGPVDIIWDIVSDERSLLLQLPGILQTTTPFLIPDPLPTGPTPIVSPSLPINLSSGPNPTVIQINARNLYGGNKEEGGLQGEIRFYRGLDNQPLDPLIAYGYNEFASTYPTLIYVCFGNAPDEPATNNVGTQFYWVANIPSPKSISFITGTYPRTLLGGTADQAAINRGANPAEMLYEVLTNPVWGRGWSPLRFNLPNWQAKAQYFRAQKSGGLSMTLSNQTIDDFIDDIESHADCKIVNNPLTGLVELQVLRGGYDPDELFVINETNSREFKRGGKTLAKTLNDIQVKYKEFISGGVNHVEEVVTSSLEAFNTGTGFLWQSDGKNIYNVVATRTRGASTITLVYGDDYVYGAEKGWFFFGDTANIDIGDRIEVEYDMDSMFSGFVDDVATDQNPANRLLTGNIRSESYDYPFFTNFIDAKKKAIRLRKLLSRNLDTYTWKMNKFASETKVADVVKVHEPKWGVSNLIVRVSKIDRGDFNSRTMDCEGMEDVWGEGIAATSFAGSIGRIINAPGPVAPSVTLTCLSGAIRVGIFASDPALTVKLYRADDAIGTGSVLIATLPGTTLYYDDAQSVGVTKYYAAQLTGFGYTDGPMSPWMGCTASADPPITPTNVLPTWIVSQSQTDIQGTATLLVEDPQNRIRSISRSTKVANDSEIDLGVFPAEPYTEVVDIVPSNSSYITFRVTYIGLDFLEVTANVVVTFNFINPIVAPTIPDAASGLIIIPFHATITHGAAVQFPPAAVTEISTYGRRRIDASGCARCRVHVHVRLPLPAGAVAAVQYVSASNTSPAEEDWVFLNGTNGPAVPADTATDIPDVSPWNKLDLLARQEIILRPVVVGGDGVTQFDTRQMFVELMGTPLGEMGDPLPDPCQDSTDNFGGYIDVAAFDDVWNTFVSTGEETTHTRSLDLTGGVDGSRALKLSIAAGSTYADGYVMGTLEISGLIPGGGANLYRMRAKVKASSNWGIPWPIYPFSGGPHISLATVDGEYPENSVAATSASTGAWEEVTTGYIAANGSGILYAKCIADSPWIVPEGIYVLFDDVIVEHLDGTIINPCAGGPTQPGDGGYQPPDTGDPPPTPPGGSRLLYLIQYRQALWGTYPPFNGTVYTISPADLLATLTAARSAGIGVFLDPVGTNRAKVNGVFNTQAYLNVLNTYAGLVDPANWFSVWGDVLREVRVIDEPNSVAHWGIAIQMSVVDGVLAKRCKEIFGDIPLQVSMRANAIEQSGIHPHYLQVVQMSYHRPRYGPVLDFMATQRAAAQRLGMQWAWGLNPENGGDGSSGITGSGGTGQWRMTPSEVRAYGLPMKADTESRSIAIWVSGSPPDPFLQQAAYQAAFTDIRP
jgi:hypothetical protein